VTGRPEMDEHGVDMQVLSLTSPGIQMQPDPQIAVADAHTANDFLAGVIGEHPRRFQRMAAVPLRTWSGWRTRTQSRSCG
jgi:2,3-dihydroxybenzoate decarboxylase